MPKKATKEEIAVHPDEGVRGIAKDLDDASSLSALADSEGGKLLQKSLVTDVVSVIDSLTSRYDKLTMQEFISLCAEAKTKIDMARAISRARKNKKYLEGLLSDALGE